ncbi:hypothetical protein WN943_001670 [Citrus x changshan-huyou]
MDIFFSQIVNDVPYMAYLQSLYECRASPEHNLEILLVNFFDFYGRKLKTTDVGVSCKGAGSFFKKSSKGFTNKGRPFLIAIEDPQKLWLVFYEARSEFSNRDLVILGTSPPHFTIY